MTKNIKYTRKGVSDTKKVNKILMPLVAILLCLVLISTSVLSGVFAKYVVRKSGTAEVTFTAFNVTVTLSVPDSVKTKLVARGAKIDPRTFASEGGSITMTGLRLAPGDDFTNAIKVEISGKPSVPVNIVIYPTITLYNKNGSALGGSTPNTIYSVPANAIKGVTATTYYMPIGFTFSYNDTTWSENNCIYQPWTTPKTANAMTKAISEGILEKITDTSATAPSSDKSERGYSGNNVFIQTFKADKDITFTIGGTNRTSFHTGFFYPLSHGSGDEIEMYDKISTYLAENQGKASFSFSYAVKVYQSKSS